MEGLLAALGHEIQDADEGKSTEHIHFDLRRSRSRRVINLGMVDPKAEELDLCIAGRDFTIKQSPGVLQSKREGGTTGAAVWRACVVFAEWIATPKNCLFQHGLLEPNSVAIELGSGISGLVPSVLSLRVKRILATDQQYALKLLQENIATNRPVSKGRSSSQKASKANWGAGNIELAALDWETDDIAAFLRRYGLEDGVDVVMACDCIYNYALIDPLVQTCVDVCKARSACKVSNQTPPKPSMCIIAQQLRQPDVFEQWLEMFLVHFRVWRVPDKMLTEALREGSGFVLHIGVLRER
ncbi:Ribosomal protein lysine methyltransferase [Vermiconidia calcicola]|uniref:Ribosomal protein lysine methyltransferase n=1 Tax=Vermiconidia calcicola TaxID=1690605 RepID=A0ACC3NLQ1_9PEZI|nr:Ribosomal protein lysine methyltransferase [Vermiconidia calcicola]